MVAMNAAVELESQSFAQVARQFLAGQHTTPAATPARAFFEARGWEPDGSRTADLVGEVLLPAVRYRRAL